MVPALASREEADLNAFGLLDSLERAMG